MIWRNRWLASYLCRPGHRRHSPPGRPLHVLLCICDHYEPGNGNAPPDQADRRVANWVDSYPKLFGSFRDSDGRPPRHSFFYPIEMYRPVEVDSIAGLCRAGFGEIEVHLHHDNDTADNLRKTLLDWKQLLVSRHGLLARHRQSGEPKYAFIHGNWALNNCRPDRRHCGVNNELDILHDTGCYADFTFPSYPDATQPARINRIYYAVAPARPLMLFQGPLVLNWKSRKFGLLPRVENGNIQGNQPPSEARLDSWLRASVQIPARPDWFFVKLHTHGAPEANQAVLLGEPMLRFHQALAARARRDPDFHYHYVTAREMYNLAKAAEAHWTGTVDDARNHQLLPPG